MLAYQLIFTACGKERKGDFSVWSKSSAITEEESDEIVKAMNYTIPYGLSEDETELFPKKTAYFRLSTGRYCLARTSYVGRVYSDQDTRSGNIIVHAYVIDDTTGIMPTSFVASDVFKSGLTYDEWHENEAPADYPAAELPSEGGGLGRNEIDGFFDDRRYGYLELFLQSVIDLYGVNNENVTFYDDNENLKYWYKIIALLLPACMQEKLSFCSQFIPVSRMPYEATVYRTENSEVMVRTVSPDIPGSDFSYEYEAGRGRKAFNFQNGTVNGNVEVSRYVKLMVGMLRDDLFKVIETVDSINKLMTKGGCTLDEAASLFNLKNGNIDWFSGLSELNATLENAKRILHDDALSATADTLYRRFIVEEGAEICPDVLPIYRFIFDYSEEASKSRIIGIYLKNCERFGISDSLPCGDYAEQIRKNAPFPWTNFIDYLFESPGFEEYFEVNGSSYNSRFLAFSSLAEGLAAMDEGQKKTACGYFLEFASSAFKNGSFEQLTPILGEMRRLGPKWESWIVKNSISLMIKDGNSLTGECEPSFLLDLAARISDADLGLVVLKRIIYEKGNDRTFIDDYIAKSLSERASFDRFEAALRADPAFSGFADAVERRRFAMNDSVSKADMDRYYHTFYRTGKDDGQFRKKLDDYLRKIPDSAVAEGCMDAYSSWFAGLPDSHLDVSDCLDDIVRALFGVDFTYLYNHAERYGISWIREILGRLLKNRRQIPNRYFVLKLGEDTRALCSEDNLPGAAERAADALRRLYANEFFTQIQSREDLDLYVRCYLNKMIAFYCVGRRKDGMEPLFECCFGALTESPFFAEAFFKELERIDPRSSERLLADAFSYAFASGNKRSAGNMRRAIIAYLDGQGRGKRKKIFAAVSANVSAQYVERVNAFVEKYRKDHESVFDRLFGGLGKKDNPGGDYTVDAPRDKRKWKE